MATQQRIIKFPHRRSAGTLYTAPADQPEEWELLSQVRGLIVTPENQPIKWDWLEEARGNVTVPAGTKLKLSISGKGSGSLAPLVELRPDDLHTLDLSRSEISDISLSHLQTMTGLKVLELTSTSITDEGLKFLQNLTGLEGLGLSHCAITGVGLGNLRNLCNLRELWISGAHVSDADLQYFFRMDKLVQLGLSGTRITDNGLQRLNGLRALMRIYLFSTQVTQTGIDNFRQALPSCRVKWKPTPQIDDSLVDVDPSTSLETLLEGLSDEVRAAFQLPLEIGSPDSESAKGLSEDAFWQIIDAFDWNKTGDDGAVTEPGISLLASKKDKDILGFADMLAEKLHLLDGESFAKEIGQDCYRGPQTRFSKNCFLSARCCVIANGREFFNEVLKNASLMPKDMEFEALLKVPNKAYERKTGKKLSYITKFSHETFANAPSWPSQYMA